MMTPTDDNQENADKREPGEKGGVAGTDSKDFSAGGPNKPEPEPEPKSD
jgi:hypothetical protein